MHKTKLTESNIRNAVFGFEDGFVSSVGTLVGIAAASQSVSFVVVSGLVLIMVEAFSMGVGSYLSEKSASELSSKTKKGNSFIVNGLLMWGSYLTAGLTVLVPYFLFKHNGLASGFSIALAFIGLFLLGFIKGKIVKRNSLKSAFEMTFIAGGAIVIGFVIGTIGSVFINGA